MKEGIAAHRGVRHKRLGEATAWSRRMQSEWDQTVMIRNHFFWGFSVSYMNCDVKMKTGRATEMPETCTQ